MNTVGSLLEDWRFWCPGGHFWNIYSYRVGPKHKWIYTKFASSTTLTLPSFPLFYPLPAPLLSIFAPSSSNKLWDILGTAVLYTLECIPSWGSSSSQMSHLPKSVYKEPLPFIESQSSLAVKFIVILCATRGKKKTCQLKYDTMHSHRLDFFYLLRVLILN